MNKRNFLIVGGQALVGLPPLVAATQAHSSRATQAVPTPSSTPLRSHRQAEWQALRGTQFGAVTPVRLSTQLTLRDVQPGPQAKGLEQFTVVFEGPSRRQLPAGLHSLQHETAGRLALYLEPINTSGGRTTYSAHFSQII
jgi:hypothetical protein